VRFVGEAELPLDESAMVMDMLCGITGPRQYIGQRSAKARSAGFSRRFSRRRSRSQQSSTVLILDASAIN
jgi:hypothetical protein